MNFSSVFRFRNQHWALLWLEIFNFECSSPLNPQSEIVFGSSLSCDGCHTSWKLSALLFFSFLPPVYQFPSKRSLAAADLGRPMPLENKKILIEQQNLMCLVILLRGKQSRRASFFAFTTMPGLSVFLSVCLSVCLQSLSLSLSLSLSSSRDLSLSLSLIHIHTQIKNFMWTIILLRRKRRESFFFSLPGCFSFCLFVSGSYFPSLSLSF